MLLRFKMNHLPPSPGFRTLAPGGRFTPLSTGRAFSLVEVTIALGLVSYSLLAMMGLFVVGLNSSRESSVETALSQIALHVASCYSGTNLPAANTELSYSYDGLLVSGSSAEKHFTVRVIDTPSDASIITDTSANLHLITLSITRASAPGITNIVQTSSFVP